MDSAILSPRTFLPAPNAKPCHILSSKQLTLCAGKVRKNQSARKRFASLRIQSEKTEGSGIDIDRRRLLLSSSTLGMSALIAGRKAKADPFPAPDLSTCVYPTTLPNGVKVDGCCPPKISGNLPVDFEFPTRLPMRTRQAAHLVDPNYTAKYESAMSKIKSLSDDDPISFAQQAKVHCAYCNGAYLVGFPSMDYQIHWSWFFQPFHRWYLYFYERILASQIGDDSFALPFWNWDAEEGMQIPGMYNNTSSPLYNKNRDECHRPPKILNFQEPKSCDNGSADSNYAAIYTQMVSAAPNYDIFHGGAYRYGSGQTPNRLRQGTLESSPHNLVHNWTGSEKNFYREDMGSLYSAGRDPIFYSHHSNIDRMWTIWNDTLHGKNYEDKDLLDSKFVFYDENRQLVQVRAGDCYDTNKLRYKYQELPLPWLKNGRSIKKAGKLRPKPPTIDYKEADSQLKSLTISQTFLVRRSIPKLKKMMTEQIEILVIEGIVVDMARNEKFNIFINFPEADSNTSYASPHYAGSFVSLSHGMVMTNKGSYKIGISETLEDVGASEDENVLVTLVPQAPEFLRKTTPIQFTTIKVEYDTK